MPTRQTPSSNTTKSSRRVNDAIRQGGEADPANAIVVTRSDLERLTDLTERYQTGRFAELAADLEDELTRAQVVDETAIPPDIVRMQSTIVFRFADTGETREVTLVYPGEVDVDAGRISVLAPIGTALIGLGVGQQIRWSTPEGERPLEVMSVRHPS